MRCVLYIDFSKKRDTTQFHPFKDKFAYENTSLDVSLGLDSAVASKYNEVKKEDGKYYLDDASLSIRVHGEGTDYEWMRLNNCKVGFKHGNGDSKDTEFKRYPEEDVKDSTSVQKLHETVNETTTSMRAFKKGEGVDASTIYLTDASVSTTTCGEGKSVSATSLFDSKVWRKVGDKFYPWWVKLTYYKVTDPNGWQEDVINASALTQSDRVLSIHSNEEYKLKETTDNLEGYTFKGWVVDNIENTTNVTPTKDINAYAKYNVQKWTVNQPSTTNGTANVTPSGEQKYKTDMTL
ncbi:MAG: hypothetical protein MJZ18_07175, partial [Bacteroidales bacterium]|nr:hypothetical protein [Bacteroidales bacterium]